MLQLVALCAATVLLSSSSSWRVLRSRTGTLTLCFDAKTENESWLVGQSQFSSAGKVAVEIDLGEDGEPKGVSRLTFTPKLRRSQLLQVDLRVPLGMVIEETKDGDILVTGALPGYSAIKQVEPGDLIRAVTAYREVLTGAPM